jgi:hypothetical protein
VYTDSNYQDRTLRGDGKSTSGYGVYLAGGLISWSSRRQHCVTTSSTEAEYIGQANAIKQIITATQFLLELRLPIIHTPVKLYADNTSSQSLAHRPSARPQSGHIDAAMHFQTREGGDGTGGHHTRCLARQCSRRLHKAIEWGQIREISRTATNTLMITLSDHTRQCQAYGGQTPQTRRSFLGFPRRFLLGFIEARGNRSPGVRLGQGRLADGTSPNVD